MLRTAFLAGLLSLSAAGAGFILGTETATRREKEVCNARVGILADTAISSSGAAVDRAYRECNEALRRMGCPDGAPLVVLPPPKD